VPLVRAAMLVPCAPTMKFGDRSKPMISSSGCSAQTNTSLVAGGGSAGPKSCCHPAQPR